MKQVLQLLARLYPAEWRARYGAEYAALLEDREPHWRDVADVAWAAVKLWAASWSLIRVVLPCVIAGGLVAVAAAWVKPVQYTSGTLVVESIPVYADSAGDLKPVAGGESQTPQFPELARNAFADREAMTRIIEKYNLYPRERAKLPLDAVIETMRSAIRVRPVWGSALDQDIELAKQMPGLDPASIDRNKKFIRAGFTVQFKYPDPHVAQSVNAELLSHLVRANLRSAEDSAQAGRPRIPTTFSVLYAPNLPEKPDRLNWIELGAMGLVGGLGSGLMLAAMVRMRRGRIAATGLVLLGMLGGGATRGQDVVHGSGPLPGFEVRRRSNQSTKGFLLY